MTSYKPYEFLTKYLSILVVILQPKLLILTKAAMAIMVIKTMSMPKQCFTMMPTPKLDNKLVHRTTSIIIQKVSNWLWFEIKVCKEVLIIIIIFVYLQPRLAILTKAMMATPISAIIKQYFTMMPTLKLDNKLVHLTTSITTQKVSNIFRGLKYFDSFFEIVY